MAVIHGKKEEDKKRALFLDRSVALLCPSILSSDLAHLARSIEELGDALDVIHCDVMDGNYVPNLTFGAPVIRSLSRYFDKPIDVHLMCRRPEILVEDCARAGATTLVVHVEAAAHIQSLLTKIRELGCFAGVALNPATPLESFKWLLPDIDMVLLMTVNPGFGGQVFIPQTRQKIVDCRRMIDESGYPIRLEIDGGISTDNVADLVRAGADMIVAGSGIFDTPSPKETAAEFQRLMRGAKAKL